MKKSTYLAGALAIALIVPGLVLGASTAANAQNVGSGQTGGSVAFVRAAGAAGQFEVEFGLFLEKAFRDNGATRESPTMRLYSAKTASDYEVHVAPARPIGDSL